MNIGEMLCVAFLSMMYFHVKVVVLWSRVGVLFVFPYF